MALIEIYCVILLLWIGPINETFAHQQTYSKVMLRAVSSYECDDSVNLIPFELNIRIKNEEGLKVVNVAFTLDKPATDMWTISLQIDKWNNGIWDEFYIVDGLVCDFLKEFVGKAWSRFRSNIEPPIQDECGIEPGSYNIKDFEVYNTDYDIPVLLTGKYRATAILFDELSTYIFCTVIEVDTV